MSNYISINLQPTSPTQAMFHSLRQTKISYLLAECPAPTMRDYSDNNWLNNLLKRNAIYSIQKIKNALDYENNEKLVHPITQYFTDRQKEINEDYKKTHNNRNIKKDTKLYQEAVISFGREQFEKCQIEDIEKHLSLFCTQFETSTGAKIVFSSLHLDEGHIDENGDKLHNYHAHILIENYNFDTHKTCLQKLDYRKLQDVVAKCFSELGFERGDPERKAIRLEHREYRKQKELETEIGKSKNNQIEDLEKQIENITIAYTEDHNTAKTNIEKAIETFAKEIERLDNEQDIKQLATMLRDLLKSKEHGTATQRDYTQIKTIREKRLELLNTANSMIESNQNLASLAQQKTTLSNQIQEDTKTKEQTLTELTTISTKLESQKAELTKLINKQAEQEQTLNRIKQDIETERKQLESAKTKQLEAANKLKAELPEQVAQAIAQNVTAEIKKIDSIETLKEEYKKLETDLFKTFNKRASKLLKEGFNQYDKTLKEQNNSFLQRNLLKNLELPEQNALLPINLNMDRETIKSTISALLQIKQRIEEKPIIKEIESSERDVLKQKNDYLYGILGDQNSLMEEKNKKIRELEGENRTLRRALESFLRLDVLKGISNLGKTLLERFNIALEHVKTVLATPKPEIERKLEHKQEERAEPKPTPIATKAPTKEETKVQETPPPTQQYTRNNSGGRGLF